MTIISTQRNTDLQALAAMLQEQQVRKVDVVAKASAIRAEGGRLIISGVEPILDEEGVTVSDGVYLPTDICDEGISGKLDIPLAYVRRLREQHLPLWDSNVNGWLERDPAKQFLVRCFRGEEGGEGIARAFLSDRYSTMDNLDALLSTLDGIRDAGVDVDITGCDLTERRMQVRVTCPQVRAAAPTLLKGYISPYSGLRGDENPIVFAGFVLSNSETGGGAWSITPRIVVEVCANGMTISKDAMRQVHLGGKLEQGTVNWSADTVSKAAALIRAKTKDAVATFLTEQYLTETVAAMEEKAGKEVDGIAAVKVITKSLKFTDAETEGILSFFVKGGQMTVGGVANAATAYAQQVSDPEVATSLEVGAAKLLVGA